MTATNQIDSSAGISSWHTRDTSNDPANTHAKLIALALTARAKRSRFEYYFVRLLPFHFALFLFSLCSFLFLCCFALFFPVSLLFRSVLSCFFLVSLCSFLFLCCLARFWVFASHLHRCLFRFGFWLVVRTGFGKNAFGPNFFRLGGGPTGTSKKVARSEKMSF